ncbi:E3 ubiquitin-protein ligase TRIM71-like [Gigantopelta aegis]|uniref:E3 ubiquitin-protein ligase TRIM71-like n=1 Tax=Gigantopelta aegis TaxID=1735272 RepID=UPI001B889F9B|nr:E3 ubiquitin-protein ligase TRIM71-like [Gigantopelta aegis]
MLGCSSKLRSSRTHSSFTLEDAHAMSQDKLTKLIPSFIHTCQDHSDQQLEYYCQQCIIPVCVKCTIINHKDHPVTEVSKQVDINKATVHESIQGFQVAQQQLKKVLISGEEIKEKINARKNEIDTIIRQNFATLQQLLHEREEALLAQNSEVANAKEACLSLQLEGIHHLLDTMTYCESLVTSAVGEYNDVELLSVAHTLQTRANQLQEEFSKTSLEVCESPTISVDINTDELATKIANVDITFNEISPNNTTAVVPFNDVVVEKELNIRIISRDSKGKELSKGGAIVSGRFVPVEKKGRPIEAKSTDCGDGTYLVSLTPQQLGQHKLSLTIKGQSIQGSPFNVSVVATRDYTILKNPVQTITGINNPWFIAFSNNGDMFVTSYSTTVYMYMTAMEDRRLPLVQKELVLYSLIIPWE